MPSGALATILPEDVESEELVGDQPGGGPLLLGEERLVARAGERRRREFAAVRRAARACLARLGYPELPVLRGAGGAPVWPPGARGSMTHCAGYAAAAVGRSDRVATVGIDAEPDLPLPPGVLDVVATPADRDRLARMPATTGTPSWDRLLFSAKESVYKAWYPCVGEWLDPQEAEVTLRPDGTFTAVLCRPGLVVDGRPLARLSGRWTVTGGILLTAVCVRAGGAVGPHDRLR